jgi:hypothetical protein
VHARRTCRSSATHCRVADNRTLYLVIHEPVTRGGLAVAGAAADARKTADTTRHTTRTRELPAGATANAGDAALPTGTATGAGELAAGAAVAVGVTSTAAWILLEDHMRRCRAGHRRAGCESFG